MVRKSNSSPRLPLDEPILRPTFRRERRALKKGIWPVAGCDEAGRGPLFGYRTNGAGGAVFGINTGFNSETYTTVTWTIGARNRYIGTDDYGTTNRLENIGVRPDIPFDYMTRDNLMSGGKLFTDAFTQAILNEIAKGQ